MTIKKEKEIQEHMYTHNIAFCFYNGLFIKRNDQ